VIVGGAGGGSTQVVVRAIGPSLAAAGVANPLQDPTLELFDGNGVSVTTNDNWQDSDGGAISATKLQPNDSRESAVLRTIPPGAYTAIVRGKNGATGVGLVEVYSLQ
jgi:hypothetical protein